MKRILDLLKSLAEFHFVRFFILFYIKLSSSLIVYEVVAKLPCIPIQRKSLATRPPLFSSKTPNTTKLLISLYMKETPLQTIWVWLWQGSEITPMNKDMRDYGEKINKLHSVRS